MERRLKVLFIWIQYFYMTQTKEEMYLNESISRSDVKILVTTRIWSTTLCTVKPATDDTILRRLLKNWNDKSGRDISANWHSVIYELENIIAIKFISIKHFDSYLIHICAWWIWPYLLISSVSRSAWIHVKIWISLCISDYLCMWISISIMCISAYICAYLDTCVCKSELTCVYLGIHAFI